MMNYEMALVGLALLLVAGYLIFHFRGRPQPSNIASLAELRAGFSGTRFTIVQFYAPL